MNYINVSFAENTSVLFDSKCAINLGENTEKYETFSVPIEKELLRISKYRQQITNTISNRLKLLDNARFMASSLSDLVNNLAKRIRLIKCKYEDDDKK